MSQADPVMYDAAAFAQDANGRELQRGARVEILASGERGRVRDVDGNYVVVVEESGYATRLAARDVRSFEAVLMADTAACPYCSKSVALFSRRLGVHRVPGGICDGSGRVVARVEMGRAIFVVQ